MHSRRISRGGFALPTVLIASVVMLTILAVSVSSVAAVRTTLKTQYYEQLAKAAGEAGVAYAKACLAKNGNVPLWTDNKPLRPSTDCAGNPLLNPEVQVLVVAGGGGGGAGHGGGGGGGGVVLDEAYPVVSGGLYPVTVGAGGAGGASQSTGSRGNDSIFGSITAIRGGGGGGRVSSTSYTPATDGGSGGGGNGTYEAANGTGASGAEVTTGQGNNGGMGSAGNSGSFAGNGGGGGGAGGVGGNASGVAIDTGVSGAGGIGFYSDISGTGLFYGGGGSGGRWGVGSVGARGLSGGGAGASGNATTGGAGLVNTGGGGGGGSSGGGLGGAGGSGVVIVRYANNGTITATGGTVVYNSGPYRIHVFRSGSSTFSVSSASDSLCPSDPRCNVTMNGNVRSSFSVSRPTVNDEGKALTIPNSGYTELVRTSTGEVWRTYRQPNVQVAVVPDLCSGAATSSLGWSNAVLSSIQGSLPNSAGAENITLANGNLSSGRMFFRKDFTVTTPGTYTVRASTDTNLDLAEIYVDGVLEVSARGGIATGTVDLTAGCHTVTARLTNKSLLARPSEFIAAIQKDGSEPIVATDTSWRVSAGASVYFSQSDYYADPDIWGPVTDVEMANSVISTWAGASGDRFTRLIGAPCANSCPFSSSTYFRDYKDFIVGANTEVLVSALCDDDCVVYVDGNPIIASSPWSNINQQSLTLTEGAHRIGVKLYNSGAVNNPAKFGVAVQNKTTGEILTRSDIKWLTARDLWTSGYNTDNDPTSYEASFRPSPAEINDPVTVDVLIVGGGGGGGNNSAGGGGGGGALFYENLPITVGVKTVTVGAGGTGAASATVRGNNGGNSAFWGYTVLGGGGGASRDGGPAPSTGGSGGGGGGTIASGAGVRDVGALGTTLQGGRGNNGTPSDAGASAKGGGGGGAGGAGVAATTTLSGDGGPGIISYLTGSRLTYAGGGMGGNTAGNPTIGLSGDAAGTSGVAALANRGGGGAGSINRDGAAGTVIIRFVTGTITGITTTGSPTVTFATIKGVNYTIYTYTASGTFNPGAIVQL
ncbi:MAG: glycine-rich domain-containing protein [Candidatus Saccharimonadota bacterium]